MHSHLCSETQFLHLEKQSVIDKLSELEKQLLGFQQKHATVQGELLDAKKELKLHKLKFASKCSALSKASKPRKDPSSTKEADNKIIIANEHPNDTIDVKQYDTPCLSAPVRCSPVASAVDKFNEIVSPVPNYASPTNTLTSFPPRS